MKNGKTESTLLNVRKRFRLTERERLICVIADEFVHGGCGYRYCDDAFAGKQTDMMVIVATNAAKSKPTPKKCHGTIAKGEQSRSKPSMSGTRQAVQPSFQRPRGLWTNAADQVRCPASPASACSR